MKKLFSMLLCGAMLVSFSACESSSNDELEGTFTKHDYVDLGLPSGILWATCNIGATNPEDYGDYFAWGETKPKETYSWDTYKYGTYDDDKDDNDCSKLIKYNPTDGKTILEASDDAATANWGGTWRMPTHAEQTELRTECTWTWTTLNGVNGYYVTSKIDTTKSIFLPAAGGYNEGISAEGVYGTYWSSSLCSEDYGLAYACGIQFRPDRYGWNEFSRKIGRSVRPVCSPR